MNSQTSHLVFVRLQQRGDVWKMVAGLVGPRCFMGALGRLPYPPDPERWLRPRRQRNRSAVAVLERPYPAGAGRRLHLADTRISLRNRCPVSRW